jgi:hypothetical protein
MDYSIQKNLYNILEKLQSKVNQGFYNPSQKEEAVKIITKIRTEYQTEIDDFIKRRDLIDKAYIDAGLITDQSFMIDYVNTKKDIDSLGLNLLYLHKHIIIDRNVRWEDQFLNLVELFFNRKDNNNSKSEFINNLIRWRFRHDDHDSKFNIDLNYSLRESAFYDYVKKEIVKAPEIMAELLKFDPIADFELDRKFNNLFKFDNSFILNLVITKYQVLNYVPEKFKDHLLINLFAINESITAKQYLHSSYKNNTVFCSLFD